MPIAIILKFGGLLKSSKSKFVTNSLNYCRSMIGNIHLINHCLIYRDETLGYVLAPMALANREQIYSFCYFIL